MCPCVLSLGCKTEVSETTIQEAKAQNVAIPTTPLSFQAKAIQPIFSYRRNQCAAIGLAAEGRQEQTDKQPDNPNGIRTSVDCERPSDIGWLRHWAIGRNLWLYTGNIPAIVGKSSFSMRPVQRQTVPNGRHKLPRNIGQQAGTERLSRFAANLKNRRTWK